MNKRMIVMIAFVAAVFVAPASAETVEVRGTIEELDAANPTLTISNPGAPAADQGRIWDFSGFAGFWYDTDDGLATETLTITATGAWDNPTLNFAYNDRTIDENMLVYTTFPIWQQYELNENEGLVVDSDNPGGDTGYWIEGWMGEKYVAIDNNADKLCELLVEFEDDEKKTLATGEEWNLGGGFALELTGIDYAGEKATVQLSKNGNPLDTGYLDTSGSEHDRVYTYTDDIGGESNVPIFSCYVDVIFSETDTVEIMYVFLIDDEVLEIKCGDKFGAMEVMTASASQVILENDETTIDLDGDTMELIMGSMYFKTADDDTMIRFYPMIEYTEPGTYEVRGTIEELDNDPTTLGFDRVWDYSEFAGFWYDLDDDLQTETLTITELDGDGESTLTFLTDRCLDENTVIYRTHAVFQEYELHENEWDTDRTTQTAMELCFSGCLEQQIGLCVESDNLGGDCGYFIEGWMGEMYVAIDGNADKLCELLLEFEDDDTKTLYTDADWDLGGGFMFELMGIDDTGTKATLRLSKDGIPLEGSLKCINTGAGSVRQDRVYTYTADIGGEDTIPVFSCYVESVFKGDFSCVQLKYAFLIDDEVLEINTGDTYGVMEVMTASATQVILENDETAIDLDTGTTKHIMGDMYFKTADDDTAIRFYPFVERTIGGEEPTPPPDTISATDTDGDGVPDAWDADNSTPAGYWVNSDGIGRMWGDMNGDDKLTSVDALMILQAVVGTIDLG